MRKILLSLIALTSINANAQTKFEVDNTTYTVTSANTVELTSGDKQATVLNVPSTVVNNGATYTVTAIGDEAYYWGKAATVTIPGTVKRIGEKAFYYCYVSNLTLNEGVEEIGKNAFASNKCTSIDIPASVKKIDDNAFFGNSSNSPLTKLTLREGLKVIGKAAFYGNSIAELNIPASVDTIYRAAFLYSNKLEKLTFNEGLVYLGDGAFNNSNKRNKTLTGNIKLPSTLKYIGEEAFLGQPITGINIPAAAETIGGSFMARTNVASITVDEGNKNFHTVGGLLFDTANSMLYAVPMTGIKQVTVPAGCIGINDGAFWGSAVTDVTLPNGLLAIGYGAFQESALANINLPNSITYIDEYAFAGSDISEVTMPESAIYIFQATFAQCNNLKTVVLPSGLKAIDIRAFYGSNNITSVTAKGSVAPALTPAYDTGEAIFTCSTAVPLYVPKGAKSAYSASDNDWSNYLTITETGKGTLLHTSAHPADSASLGKYQYASFQIQFGEAISLVNDKPEVYIRPESPFMWPVKTFAGGWKAAIEANNTLSVYGMNEDGDMDYFVTEKGKCYYVTIPAGIVKNAAGEENEQITLFYYGTSTTAGIGNAPGGSGEASVTARFGLNGLKAGTAQKGIVITKHADGTTKKTVVK